MENSLLIDGDGHVMEPRDLWEERMDRDRWGDWIPHEDPETEAFYIGGEQRHGGREAQAATAEKLGMDLDEFRAMLANLEKPGGHDPHARVEDMDADGLDAAVLYPSSGLFFGPLDPIEALHDPEFVRDCQAAYNDWLLDDYCGAYPERLFGMALVPLQDVDLAVAEARRAVGKGAKGICVRPAAYVDELPLSHPVYHPFWEAVQELGVPVAFHPGVHVDVPGACRYYKLVREDPDIAKVNTLVDEVHGGSGLGQALGNMADMVITVGRLLMGGVCERFPDLRFLFLEAGGGWIGTLLERMDEQVEAFSAEARWLSMKPSDYFKRQCYMGFEAEEWNLAQTAEFLGADRIIWATDYPHPEYHPGIVDELRENIAALPESDQRRIMALNEIEAYGLSELAGRAQVPS